MTTAALRPAPSDITILRWRFRRATDRVFTPHRAWAVAVVCLNLAVYAYIAWTAFGPTFVADEVGSVGAALTIARGDSPWTLAGPGYMPGVATLLAPAWWFTDDAFLVYRVGLAIGVVTAVACIAPLAAIARRFGIASRSGAVVIAGIVTLAPARTLSSNYLVAEALLTLTTACGIAVAFWAADRPSAGRMALLGAVAALPFMTHGRGIAVTAAIGLWVLIFAGRRWRLTLAAAVTTIAGVAGAFALYSWIVARLYVSDSRVSQTFDGWSTHTVPELAGTAAGIAWYAVTAWPAVAVMGILVIAKRSRHKGPALAVAIAMVTTLALTLVQLDKETSLIGFERLDPWIYGRYLDHLFTITAVVGLAVLIRVRTAAWPWIVGAVTVAVSAAFLLITVPQIPEGGFWVDFHVAGVSHLLSFENYINGDPEPWLLLVVASTVIAIVIAFAARTEALLLILALMWVSLSLATDATRIDPREEPGRLTPELVAPLANFAEDEPIGFNLKRGLGMNGFVFAAHPRPIVITNVTDAVGRYQGLYHPFLDGEPRDYGALLYDSGVNLGYTLWIFPGPVFDTLDEQGLLMRSEESEGLEGLSR